MSQNQGFLLSVTEQEFQIIGAALGEMPAKVSRPVMNNLEMQAQMQAAQRNQPKTGESGEVKCEKPESGKTETKEKAK